jgi:hypothetical protein
MPVRARRNVGERSADNVANGLRAGAHFELEANRAPSRSCKGGELAGLA